MGDIDYAWKRPKMVSDFLAWEVEGNQPRLSIIEFSVSFVITVTFYTMFTSTQIDNILSYIITGYKHS